MSNMFENWTDETFESVIKLVKDEAWPKAKTARDRDAVLHLVEWLTAARFPKKEVA